MSRRNRNIIFTAIGLLLLVLLIALSQGRKNYSWVQHYKGDSKDPYGTLVIKGMLEKYIKGEPLKVLEDTTLEQLLKEDEISNYVFIGNNQYLDSIDRERLFDYVDEGNNAFIISRYLGKEFLEELLYYDYDYEYDCEYWEWEGYEEHFDTAVEMNLKHEDLNLLIPPHFNYIYRGKYVRYPWQYFSEDLLCYDEDEDYITVLGRIDEEFTNFFRVEYGGGYFYFHTNPYIFSNIALLDKERLPYVSAVFSHLEAGPVFWDEGSKIRTFPRRKNRISDRSPLEYILSQRALAWSWYTLIAMSILYLLFRTKRRQNVIPVLEPNTNTSLEFIQTLGHLYFLQQNHKVIATHKTKLLLGFIRERYSIQTQQLNEEFEALLASKSEVAIEEIKAIFTLARNIETSSIVSEQTLINYHKLINAFYKNCK